MGLSLRTKLAGGFGVILLIFVVAGLAAVRNMREQRDTLDAVRLRDMPAIRLLSDASLDMQLYRKAEKDILLNMGDRAALKGYLEKLERIAQTMRGNFRDLQALLQDNPQAGTQARTMAVEAANAFAAYDDVVRPLSRKIVAGDASMNAGQANAYYTGFKNHVHTTEKNLETLERQFMTRIVASQQVLAEETRGTERMLLLSICGSVLFGIVVAALVLLSVTRPLGRVVALAKAVAAGDLEARAVGAFSAEMAVLRDSIEGMMQALKGKIAETEQKSAEAAEEGQRAKQAAGEAQAARADAERARAEGMMEAAAQLELAVKGISAASEDISAQVRQASQGAERQSARLGETAAAVEQMNSRVLDVAKNAANTAQNTEAAHARAGEGAGVVRQVVEGMDEVRRFSAELKNSMDELGGKVGDIGRIMSVISDIADQTNLLALNAAIEAARAGDAGRGFAVVADEVRKLAEKTMSATTEVGDAVSGIQSGAKANTEHMDRALAAVQQTTEMAGHCGDVLREIVAMVDEASDQVRAIAAAGEEQSSSSQRITTSVEEINGISRDTVEVMEHSTQAVAQLSEQTQALRTLVNRMKSGA